MISSRRFRITKISKLTHSAGLFKYLDKSSMDSHFLVICESIRWVNIEVNCENAAEKFMEMFILIKLKLCVFPFSDMSELIKLEVEFCVVFDSVEWTSFSYQYYPCFVLPTMYPCAIWISIEHNSLLRALLCFPFSLSFFFFLQFLIWSLSASLFSSQSLTFTLVADSEA